MLVKWNNGNALAPKKNRETGSFWDELFDRMTDWNPALTPGDHGIEVETSDTSVTARLPLAGCKPDEFDVEVVGDFLTVRVERCTEDEDKDTGEGEGRHYLRKERRCESFEETVKLPFEVKGSEAKAKYADGVLTVIIPRTAMPTTHSVKVQ